MQLRRRQRAPSVDDERSVLRHHHRDLTRLDFLLLTSRIDWYPVSSFVSPNDKTDDDLDRRGKRHATLTALINVVFGLIEVIGNKLEGRCLGEVFIGKTLEHALQADIFSLIRGRSFCKNLSC